MQNAEGKKIVIPLPRFERRFFIIALFVGLSLIGFVYWYKMVRPFLWISGAHVEAFSTVVSSDLEGRIVEIGPQEGDYVKKGQVLFILDRDFAVAKQAQAKQSIDTLKTQIERENERLGKTLEEYLAAANDVELGVGSEDKVKRLLTVMEEAREKSETAANQLKAIQSNFSALDLEVKKLTFTAPFDGIILKRAKNVGAVVSFGEPIYVLCDLDRLWIEAEVPEREIGRLAIGTPARVKLPAYPGQEWSGKVTYIGSSTVAKSALLPFSGHEEAVPIKISLQNASFSPKPGLSAQAGLKVR